MKIQGYFP